MIDHLPCPIPGCNHFTHWPQPTFLLQIYLTTSLQPRQPPCHLLPCRPINLHCCCGQLLFPAPPHQHASSAPSASSHNTMSSTTHHHQYIHPLPPTSHHQHPSTLSTLEHSSSIQTARMGLTTCGISASLSSYTPNFRNTWCPHFKHRNRSNFLRIQSHTIQAIHQFHPLLVATLPPPHVCPLSLHH
jgi:hypothetical protein